MVSRLAPLRLLVLLKLFWGMDFMAVQTEIEMHFIGLILAASLFTIGIVLFIWEFIKHGLPTDEALGAIDIS
jgi:nitric oxide reductase subunit B